jgi:hypothetical protein
VVYKCCAVAALRAAGTQDGSVWRIQVRVSERLKLLPPLIGGSKDPSNLENDEHEHEQIYKGTAHRFFSSGRSGGGNCYAFASTGNYLHTLKRDETHEPSFNMRKNARSCVSGYTK